MCFFRRRPPPTKDVCLHVADSHTGNHPEDDFTPLETIQRSYSVIRERILFELERETFKPKRGVIEDIECYHDEEMGDVIVGKEFCKEIGVKAKRFEGMITMYNGNDEMTYQMARSHPRIKHLTNDQCNKIPPLLMME
ncbi:hypothetical protein Tco_1516964 [Tanacetum coccineum]